MLFQKAFDKIQCHSWQITLSKVGMEDNFLKSDKGHLGKKPSVTMIYYGERLNAFLQSGQEKFTLTTAIPHYIEGPSQYV